MKPGGLLIAVGKGKPAEDDDEELGDDDTGEDKLDAAKEVLAAFEAGDAKRLSAALELHYLACSGEG